VAHGLLQSPPLHGLLPLHEIVKDDPNSTIDLNNKKLQNKACPLPLWPQPHGIPVLTSPTFSILPPLIHLSLHIGHTWDVHLLTYLPPNVISPFPYNHLAMTLPQP
jgi:hypothetical protein